jgi:hypothetical protein
MKCYRRIAYFFALALFGFITTLLLLLPSQASAQTVVGTIPSPADTVWHDLEVYEKGNVVFIADDTNAQILIYNATTLQYVGTISLAAYLPDTPQCTALHEGTGTLYVTVGQLSANAYTTLVIIDADTYSIIDDIIDIDRAVSARTIDEARGRLYLWSYSWDMPLYALDVYSNTIVGSLDTKDYAGSGLLAFAGERALNPATGELVFTNIHNDTFVVVDGLAMTAETISAPDSRGRGGTWNPAENKIYITTIDWNGYFVYDRDTGTSTTAACVNDGTDLLYSAATNRVYSGAEIDGDSVVIEGDSDACQEVAIAPGLSDVGVLNPTRHVYFASADQVKVLDEDSLTVVSTIPGCEPDAYGGVDCQIVVSPQMGRVFIRSYWSSPTEGNCIQVIEEDLPVSQEDLLATWDGQGVYYRNSDNGAWVKLASPATMITCGDIDEDGIDDIIGLWPTQGGIWVKYSGTGAWARLSSTAVHIASGDMNGDGRDDLLGTWDGQGVYYRDSETGLWIKMASPATMITTGDIDGDETDDLIGIWPSQGGVWVKYSQTGAWARLSSTATDIATGDLNGDGRDDLLATWTGQGVYYRDSISGSWVKMASEATQVTCGDLDTDGKADLIGIWPGQGGVWAKYSLTGTWARLSSTARDISAGVMRLEGGALGLEDKPLPSQAFTGVEEGPYLTGTHQDLSDTAPDGPRFNAREQKNLDPQESFRGVAIRRILGPGEPGFRAVQQKDQFPRKGPDRKRDPRNPL